MMAEEPDDVLSPEQVAAEIKAAGIPLTAGNLQAMIAAARAQVGAKVERAVDLFPLKPMLPSHVSYEVGRKAAASGKLRAQKFGSDDDWFVTKADVEEWIRDNPKRWFESEGAVAEWLTFIAQLKPKWIA